MFRLPIITSFTNNVQHILRHGQISEQTLGVQNIKYIPLPLPTRVQDRVTGAQNELLRLKSTFRSLELSRRGSNLTRWKVLPEFPA